MNRIDDFEIKRQSDVKVCGMIARIIKITNKKTKKTSYSCTLPLVVNKNTKHEAVKEIEFLMTMIQRMKVINKNTRGTKK